MTTTTPIPADHFLCFEDGISYSVRAKVFGVLVRLAAPIVDHYHGDLYHDAHWLDDHVEGPMHFYFGVRDTGTAIGTDRDLIVKYNTDAWRIDLTVTPRGKWEAHLTAIK